MIKQQYVPRFCFFSPKSPIGLFRSSYLDLRMGAQFVLMAGFLLFACLSQQNIHRQATISFCMFQPTMLETCCEYGLDIGRKMRGHLQGNTVHGILWEVLGNPQNHERHGGLVASRRGRLAEARLVSGMRVCLLVWKFVPWAQQFPCAHGYSPLTSGTESVSFSPAFAGTAL